MKIIRMIYRYIEIDVDYFFSKGNLFKKLVTISSVNFSAIFSLLKINIPAYIDGQFILSDKPLTIKTFLSGIYDFWFETRETNIFNTKSPVIFDVGANVGQFLIGVKNILPNAAVHSFEPDPKTFEYLTKNSARLKNVTINNLALSEKDGFLEFYQSKVSSEWSSLVKPYTGDFNLIKVDSKKLDDYIASKSVVIIDLLKIDVEGAEMLVLKGGEKTLKISKFILVEASIDRSEDNMKSSDILKFLFDKGFEIDSVGRIFRERVGSSQSSVNIILRNKNLA